MNAFFCLLTEIPSPQINFALFLPELILGGIACVVMLIDAFVKPQQRWTTGGVSLAGIILAAISCVWLRTSGIEIKGNDYNGMVVLDGLRLSFSLIVLFVSALTLLISIYWTENENLPAGEFHALLMFATVGMVMMASGGDLVMIFLGLEILSISTYVLAGFRRTDLRSNESSMKYFILGSFSSAFLLYGIALIYGGTATQTMPGTTNIAEITAQINGSQFPALLFVGAAMMLVGFGFKIATVPFHVWTPDVYEGAPTPVTAFMAAGPKAAGFAAFLRVFVFGFPFMTIFAESTVYGKLNLTWTSLLTILAILTMTVGNVAAIVQNNVKRMLAYSSIAHAGYALTGFLAAGSAAGLDERKDALASVAFYLLTYSIMNLGAFAIITLLAQKGDRRLDFEDFNGIGQKSPALSASLMIFMLSLLGLPLTAGFMGKLFVFSNAYSAGYKWLVVIGVINSAISAYYYLRLIIVMFFRERTTEWTPPAIPAVISAVLIITIVGTIFLGIFPDSVMNAFGKSQPKANVRLE
jgi:NADH-quinone oxidoreductase subunit N